MKKVVLAGGSGFLGQALARSLSADGHEVVVLGRSVAPRGASGRFVVWDGRKLGDWKSELEGAEALFNLTGRSVDCRYTKENRDLILNSRVDSTQVLGQAVQGLLRSSQSVAQLQHCYHLQGSKRGLGTTRRIKR